MFGHRHLLQDLAGDVSRGKVRLLLGARQTGKTELLGQVASGPGSMLFDLQESGQRRRFESDPGRFRQVLRGLGSEVRTILVDEIQRVPALLDEVQWIQDHEKQRFEFFLTGSSARKLRYGSSNLLPGRMHLYSIFPIVRWEEGHEGALGHAPALPSKSPPPFAERSLDARLLFGSLPGIVSEEPQQASRTLDAYVAVYLEEEIRREALVRDLGAFANFLRLAAIESGRVVNLANLSRESGISASTLRSYYGVLVDTFVGHWIQSYSGSARKRLLSTPRFLFFDTGVRNAAAELRAEPALLGVHGGELLEQWVTLELLQRARYLGRGYDLTTWRTVDGPEVDCIWQTPEEVVPVEVKWTTNPSAGDARHVERFLDLYPKRARRGLVVCRCALPERLTERVTAMPWQAL